MDVFANAVEIVQYEDEVWEKRINDDLILINYTKFNIPRKIFSYYYHGKGKYHKNKKHY